MFDVPGFHRVSASERETGVGIKLGLQNLGTMLIEECFHGASEGSADPGTAIFGEHPYFDFCWLAWSCRNFGCANNTVVAACYESRVYVSSPYAAELFTGGFWRCPPDNVVAS